MKKKQNKLQLKIESLNKTITDLEYTLRRKDSTIADLEKKVSQFEVAKSINEGRVDSTVRVLQDHIRNLMEVIRWERNNATANHPFQPNINQLTEEEKQDRYRCPRYNPLY